MTAGPEDFSGQVPGIRLPGVTVHTGTAVPSPVRLIVIPLIIYAVWVLETFLLEGSLGVFPRYQPGVYFIYVLVACILIGTFAPVLLLKSGFLSGAVNMYQAGFRSLRRTVITAGITACLGYIVFGAAVPPGASPARLIGTVLFLLPVAVSSVMVCWVLIGTHLQAYVRQYGAFVSIVTGIAVTGVLFGISFAAHSPPLSDPWHILVAIGIGTATAVIFFAIRDVWATVIFASFALAGSVHNLFDPAYIDPVSLPLVLSSVLALLALAVSEWYLMKRFITIRIPAQKRGS